MQDGEGDRHGFDVGDQLELGAARLPIGPVDVAAAEDRRHLAGEAGDGGPHGLGLHRRRGLEL